MVAVLLVDPDDVERSRIAGALRRSGQEVLEARDEAEALVLLEPRPMALVIVAEEAPPGPVRELIGRLRPCSHGALVLIGQGQEVHPTEALELGVHHFVPRPVDLELLRARVAAYLRPLWDQGRQPGHGGGRRGLCDPSRQS